MRCRRAVDGKFEILLASYQNEQGLDVIHEALVFDTLEEMMEFYLPLARAGVSDDEISATVAEVCGEKQ